MGCNTSNEVKTEVPDTNGNDARDLKADGNENINGEDKIGVENENDNDNGNEEIEEFDKSTSAKTVTLKSTRPNSEASAVSIKAELGSDDGPETTVTIEHQNGDFLDVEEALAEELAAAKIQAAFRGHQTRKNMKQADNPAEAEPTKEQLEAEFRADDEELCHAATKIQASFRGHMSRKNETEKTNDPANNAVDDEIADIDLTDPDLSKAAVKIQASFRGHMARKEHDK